MVNNNKYTATQLDFLRLHYLQLSRQNLTQAFNRFFGLDKTVAQIRSTMKNHRITSGRSGYFVKGQAAWNHGKKGYMGANATSFKKGSIPPNLKPLGAERVDARDGYILLKIPECNPYTGASTRYKHKHVHIYEQAYGPVPEGHVVIFKDGNCLNFNLNNLTLLNRRELLVLNQHGYKTQPDALKPSILALAQLEAKAGFSLNVKGRRPKNKIKEMAL